MRRSTVFFQFISDQTPITIRLCFGSFFGNRQYARSRNRAWQISEKHWVRVASNARSNLLWLNRNLETSGSECARVAYVDFTWTTSGCTSVRLPFSSERTCSSTTRYYDRVKAIIAVTRLQEIRSIFNIAKPLVDRRVKLAHPLFATQNLH